MLSSLVRRDGRLVFRTGSSWHRARKVESPSLRHFTRNSQLLLVSRQAIRPQLPYLYANSNRSTPFQRQVARLLSTETRKVIKDTVIGAIRYNIYGWTLVALLTTAYVGWNHEQQEAKTPTPHDWSFWTRFQFREAKEKQSPSQLQGFEAPSWPDVAEKIKKALDRLEDPNIDGQGIKSALGEGEGAILIEGVGKTGADVSGKSEPWRRGYFEALMTAGMAAEHVDGAVKDRTRPRRIYASEYVIGPSNAKPAPMPLTKSGIEEAPLEENCEPFFDPPQVFYMKVLTTTGFNNDQKMQAAVAYADWLSFKGLSSSARDMYDWAIDIASASYGPGQEVPINKQTGLLQPRTSSPITSNLLTAATSLACHFAQSGDLTSALPAFLSVLQAQQRLPPRQSRHEYRAAETDSSWGWLSAIIKDAPYPPPPPSGDEPATQSPDSTCNEAGTLAHIGEILFVLPDKSLPKLLKPTSGAKSTNAIEPTAPQEAGLTWARQAVDLAEEAVETLCGRDERPPIVLPGQKSPVHKSRSKELGISDAELTKVKLSCTQCLEMAVHNWEAMVERLAEQERHLTIARSKAAKGETEVPTDQVPPASSSWLGFWKSTDPNTSVLRDDRPVGKWTEEARAVGQRKVTIRQMLREERLPMQRL